MVAVCAAHIVPASTSQMRRGLPRAFELFTFLLAENGQLNYNIDITEPKAWIT